jgi:hypothetical protein
MNACDEKKLSERGGPTGRRVWVQTNCRSNDPKVSLGGLVATCLPLDPRSAGSNPAADDGCFKGNKNP